MRRLTYRPAALESILDFIARDNPQRALSFADELRQQCRKLPSFPGTVGACGRNRGPISAAMAALANNCVSTPAKLPFKTKA